MITAAWQALDLAPLQRGERVLIHSAVGEGPRCLCHRGRTYQKRSASFRNRAQRFEDVAKNVDIVINFASGELEAGSYAVLKSGGHYVTTLQVGNQADANQLGIRTASVFATPISDLLTRAAQLIDSGSVKVVVQCTFPLNEIQATMDYHQSAKQLGKVVLIISWNFIQSVKRLFS